MKLTKKKLKKIAEAAQAEEKKATGYHQSKAWSALCSAAEEALRQKTRKERLTPGVTRDSLD